MIRLNLSKEPRWVDLAPGVEVLVAPITSGIILAARNQPEFREVVAGEFDPEDVEIALDAAVARLAIRDWRGVMDDDGESLPVTPGAIDALIGLWPIWRAWREKVMTPALVLASEKNGSAASPTGPSATAETTVRPAKGSATTVPDA